MTTDRGGPAAPKAKETVVLGEIVTRLLDVPNPLPPDESAQLLELVPGQLPLRATHPVQRVQSPDLGFGVDCQLQTGSGGTARTIGIVAAHAVLTGGHILQGSAYAKVLVGVSTGRRRWSHYAARPGVVEVVQKASAAELPDAFLTAPTLPRLLDFAAVGRQIVEQVQSRPGLERGVRLKTQPTRLRWALVVDEAAARSWVELDLQEDGTFLVRLRARSADIADLVRYCEDVALHVWLLSALTGAFERSLRRANKVAELAPALEYLGHLWNPRAHLPRSVHHLWEPIEQVPQLSREWHTQVTRVRDGISLLTLRSQVDTISQNGDW